MAWSPVRGQKDSVQHIFDDMYDNVRVHALFSADYDAMALTAAEYDGVEMEARTYDLWPIDIPNANLGDVADAREHFPRETPMASCPTRRRRQPTCHSTRRQNFSEKKTHNNNNR